ncbi:MAG: hypothetical protein JJ992_10030 [Planctomycetes bacterium]|nr:hypothetical protein [Planctomycetota bacterium]
MADPKLQPENPDPRSGRPPNETSASESSAGAQSSAAGEPSDSLPEEICHPDGRIEHPRVRRETTDIHFAPMLIGFLAGAGVLVVLGYSVWRLYWYQANSLERLRGPRSPFVSRQPEKMPPQPRLEQLERISGDKAANVFWRLAAKERDLHHYGNTSDQGFVHIPVERAMELVVKDLPIRSPPDVDPTKSNGLVDGGESNSGRMLAQEPLPWD